jgi:hypothetical protein
MTKEAHVWGKRDRDDEKWPWIGKESKGSKKEKQGRGNSEKVKRNKSRYGERGTGISKYG